MAQTAGSGVCRWGLWHGHPSRYRPGRSGDYWDVKIAGNVERDRQVDRELQELGWTVERFWDFEIRRNLDQVVERVKTVIADRSVTVGRLTIGKR